MTKMFPLFSTKTRLKMIFQMNPIYSDFIDETEEEEVNEASGRQSTMSQIDDILSSASESQLSNDTLIDKENIR